MNKICTTCTRYKDTLRCCVKGCKDDLCEDCVHFLRLTPNSMQIAETYILPMCFKHAPFVKEVMEKSPEAKDREKMAIWLQTNINPTNPERLMRFINTAANNIPPLH